MLLASPKALLNVVIESVISRNIAIVFVFEVTTCGTGMLSMRYVPMRNGMGLADYPPGKYANECGPMNGLPIFIFRLNVKNRQGEEYGPGT